MPSAAAARPFGLVATILGVSLALAGCGAPPDKEMNEARGAIAAARAAGAQEYATDDYQAAIASLKRSEEAVAQRDYRLALNYALDSRERADAAARTAANLKAQAQSDAEVAVRELQQALDRARQRLATADSARSRRRDYANLQAGLNYTETALQKARTMFEQGQYGLAREEAQSARVELEKIVAAFEAPPPAPAARKRR
jgi:hypothetical protein